MHDVQRVRAPTTSNSTLLPLIFVPSLPALDFDRLYETYDDDIATNAARDRAEPDLGARGSSSADSWSTDVITPSKQLALDDFEPLLAEFAVDVYFAGHNHNYETTYPVYNGSTVGKKSYTEPAAPIHILSGSAGPPEWDLFGAGAEWTREPRIIANTYSRMTLHNASYATFEQVANDNSTVLDSFTIVQTRRNRSAPFPCFFSGGRRGGGA